MVRDPPRKSEQASRAVRSRREQRAQCSQSGTACTERRQRHGRRRRNCLRIHGPQRQRLRRVLTASGAGGQAAYYWESSQSRDPSTDQSRRSSSQTDWHLDHRKRRRRRVRERLIKISPSVEKCMENEEFLVCMKLGRDAVELIDFRGLRVDDSFSRDLPIRGQ